MKTTIEIIELHTEEQAAFKIHQLSPTIEKVIGILKEDEQFLIGEVENTIYKIPFADIFYIEVVDKKVFFILKNKSIKTQISCISLRRS